MKIDKLFTNGVLKTILWFGSRERFYDRVEYFEDSYFWADYNIIEPTESLEHAIDKLKKKVRN